MNDIIETVIDKLFKRIYTNKEEREEFNKQIKVFYNKTLNDIIFVSLICDKKNVYKKNVFWYRRNNNDVLGYSYLEDHSEELESFLFNDSFSIVDLNIIISDYNDTIFVKKLYSRHYSLDIIKFNKVLTSGIVVYELSTKDIFTTLMVGEIGLFAERNGNEYLIISDPISEHIKTYRNIGIILLFKYISETNSYNTNLLLPNVIHHKNNLCFGSDIDTLENSNGLLVTMNGLSEFIEVFDMSSINELNT